MPSTECIEFLKAFAPKHNIIFYKLEPNCDRQTLNTLPSELILSSYALFPKWTMVLPLLKTEEELLAQMKPKTRYNIKLAQKKGVTVTEVTNEKGFKMFADLYFETTKRQHYHGHDRNYHKIIFESLKDSIAHILVASYEGVPVAAYELFLFNNTLYYPYGGSSLLHRNVMGANLLMWESIKFGKAHGASFYDMWGSAPPDYPEDHPFAGFTRLKQGYGSEFKEFIGSYDLVCSTILYKLFMKANTLRQLMLKFR
jgi:lipid II:glycine glycyltransferase (peptidoglycan interpeptide bridge formation enzyme)